MVGGAVVEGRVHCIVRTGFSDIEAVSRTGGGVDMTAAARPMKRHARAGKTYVTWCGSALDDVLWTDDAAEVTCKTCATIIAGESAKAAKA